MSPTNFLSRSPGASFKFTTRAPGFDARDEFSLSFDSWVRLDPSTKGCQPVALSTSILAAIEVGRLESETTTNWKAAFSFELGKPSQSLDSFAVTVDPPGDAKGKTQTGELNGPEVCLSCEQLPHLSVEPSIQGDSPGPQVGLHIHELAG